MRTIRRGSRIASRRYVRDERGRFASTGSSDTDSPDDSAATAAKVAGATTALVIAATAAGTAVAVTTYRRDTGALVAAYRSALAAEQMDYRVNKLLDRHRAIQRTTNTRRRK